MSYLIRDSKELKGTAYFELYPDRFSGSHGHSSSIFLEECHWELLCTIVQKHFPAYNHYGPQTMNASIWELVLKDFGALSRRLANGERTSGIRDQISFMSEQTENEFLVNEDTNLKRLKTSIDELSEWISASIEKTGFVSVLGL